MLVRSRWLALASITALVWLQLPAALIAQEKDRLKFEERMLTRHAGLEPAEDGEARHGGLVDFPFGGDGRDQRLTWARATCSQPRFAPHLRDTPRRLRSRGEQPPLVDDFVLRAECGAGGVHKGGASAETR